jgi:3-oxoacyl-[acyl-carrier protein] reductase
VHEKSALITGASRGIGLGLARALASNGYGLTVGGRDAERLSVVAEELMEAGASAVVAVPGDLADESYSEEALATHDKEFGAMDCLVLNAGVGTAGSFASFPMHRFDKTVSVNLRAPFALLQASLPLLRLGAAKDPVLGARVLAMSSISGVYAEAGLAAYGATKAALLSLIDALNAEESGNGISGTAFAPGYVDTDMTAWARDRIPPDSMIPVDDIVRVATAVMGLSARSVISHIVISRASTSGFTA